jgi:hypothetical protein
LKCEHTTKPPHSIDFGVCISSSSFLLHFTSRPSNWWLSYITAYLFAWALGNYALTFLMVKRNVFVAASHCAAQQQMSPILFDYMNTYLA